MTELNPTPGTDPAQVDPHVTWPELPEPGDAAGKDPSGDSAVSALLCRLSELPALPVARHGESYAVLHDELLAALNETTAEHPTARPASAGPTNPPGDATNEQA